MVSFSGSRGHRRSGATLRPHSKKWRIFRRICHARPAGIDIPFSRHTSAWHPAAIGGVVATGLAAQQMLLERFAPRSDRQPSMPTCKPWVGGILHVPPGVGLPSWRWLARVCPCPNDRGAAAGCLVNPCVRRRRDIPAGEATVSPMRHAGNRRLAARHLRTSFYRPRTPAQNHKGERRPTALR